jgi:hypothetical protein
MLPVRRHVLLLKQAGNAKGKYGAGVRRGWHAKGNKILLFRFATAGFDAITGTVGKAPRALRGFRIRHGAARPRVKRGRSGENLAKVCRKSDPAAAPPAVG